jgi:hypothetical protein
MRELRWRLSRLASRHATDELHDRIDRVLEELADLRARILETDPPPESLHDEVERQRRAAARTRAKELFQRLIAIRQECFTLIRESEGIAQEAALDRLLEGCTSDGSGSGLAFAEGAKLQDVRQVERPPYLAFLNELFDELGLEAIERLKKEDLRGEIRKRWPPEFGLHPAKDGLQPSKNLVDPMATILRSLEAKRGGARRQRPR